MKLLHVVVTLVTISFGFGKSTSNDNDFRIIGGEQLTDDKKWPWLVSLQGDIPIVSALGIPLVKKTAYCGGSVINSKWILTAAHCFHGDDQEKKMNPKYWTARLATVSLSAGFLGTIKGWLSSIFGKDDWAQWNMDVEKIIIYPNYDNNRLRRDVALIKLKKALPNGSEFDKIAQIQLPEQGEYDFPTGGQKCVVQGWGCTKDRGSVSSKAMQVELPVLSDSDCQRAWGVNTQENICAGYSGDNIGTCPGDSGGPLVCEKGSRRIQVGIVSFGSANNMGSYYGSYARVAHYVNWIKSTIASN